MRITKKIIRVVLLLCVAMTELLHVQVQAQADPGYIATLRYIDPTNKDYQKFVAREAAAATQGGRLTSVVTTSVVGERLLLATESGNYLVGADGSFVDIGYWSEPELPPAINKNGDIAVSVNSDNVVKVVPEGSRQYVGLYYYTAATGEWREIFPPSGYNFYGLNTLNNLGELTSLLVTENPPFSKNYSFFIYRHNGRGAGQIASVPVRITSSGLPTMVRFGLANDDGDIIFSAPSFEVYLLKLGDTSAKTVKLACRPEALSGGGLLNTGTFVFHAGTSSSAFFCTLNPRNSAEYKYSVQVPSRDRINIKVTEFVGPNYPLPSYSGGLYASLQAAYGKPTIERTTPTEQFIWDEVPLMASGDTALNFTPLYTFPVASGKFLSFGKDPATGAYGIASFNLRLPEYKTVVGKKSVRKNELRVTLDTQIVSGAPIPSPYKARSRRVNIITYTSTTASLTAKSRRSRFFNIAFTESKNPTPKPIAVTYRTEVPKNKKQKLLMCIDCLPSETLEARRDKTVVVY